VRQYLTGEGPTGESAASKAQIKVTSAFDYLTDDVLPPPKPQPLSATSPAGAAQSVAVASNVPVGPSPNAFTTLRGIAAPLSIPNVDTDMIIPKQFLKTLKRTGLGNALFHTLRKDPSSGEPTDFILNKVPYDHAKVLVCTGENFGCGSSREHAAWSLKDFGISAVIAPSFGEIFKTNSMQNGLLPVVLPQEACAQLYEDAVAGLELEVDLQDQVVRRFNGQPPIPFKVEEFRRHRLLNGLDDIALTLQKAPAIDEFETGRSEAWPWLDGFGYVKGGGRIDAKEVKKKGKVDW